MLLQDLTWEAVAALPKSTPVVLPVAAVEQHGHHLPLYTDSYLLGEVLERVETSVGEQYVSTPLMWCGNSHHHLDFTGTLSLSPRNFLALLNDLLENIVKHGFQRILVLSGHGGNEVPAKQATFEFRQRYRDRRDLLLLSGTYWSLGAPPQESIPMLHQGAMGHACEWETSMMLVVAPELVGDFTAARPIESGNPFRPAARAWVTQDRSDVGHVGHPAQASAEKGERLLNKFSADVAQIIKRMAAWDGQSWEG